MRKKNFKGRCEKRILSKCEKLFKSYDPIQNAYADILEANPNKKTKQESIHAATPDNLQAQINLAEHIQVIAAQGKHSDVGLKNIRSTRKKEQNRTHRDYVKEGHING